MRAILTEGLARPPKTDPGRAPQLGWLPIRRLVIDPDYQRDIKRDSRRAIERIAREFAWAKFSAVVVAPTTLDRFAIIDGQHRTTAAALCGYDRVPCLILPLGKEEQAASFAAINGTVTKVTPWVLFKAALAAGASWAVEAECAVRDAGCRLMTYNKATAARSAGEVYGVNTIRELIARHGAETVTLALAAYRRSIYGDLPLAWGNVFLHAWIAAVAATKGAAGAERLAAFHDEFDILEADDLVLAAQREARRQGEKPAAHWAALAERTGEALAAFLGAETREAAE